MVTDDKTGGTAAYLKHSNKGVHKTAKNPESISKYCSQKDDKKEVTY